MRKEIKKLLFVIALISVIVVGSIPIITYPDNDNDFINDYTLDNAYDFARNVVRNITRHNKQITIHLDTVEHYLDHNLTIAKIELDIAQEILDMMLYDANILSEFYAYYEYECKIILIEDYLNNTVNIYEGALNRCSALFSLYQQIMMYEKGEVGGQG